MNFIWRQIVLIYRSATQRGVSMKRGPSQISAEMTTGRGPCEHKHTLSGVHLSLKYIRSLQKQLFFNNVNGNTLE